MPLESRGHVRLIRSFLHAEFLCVEQHAAVGVCLSYSPTNLSYCTDGQTPAACKSFRLQMPRMATPAGLTAGWYFRDSKDTAKVRFYIPKFFLIRSRLERLLRYAFFLAALPHCITYLEPTVLDSGLENLAHATYRLQSVIRYQFFEVTRAVTVYVGLREHVRDTSHARIRQTKPIKVPVLHKHLIYAFGNLLRWISA